ncbi:pLS20_p028 family conjugation system transmembrane protein [Bacillus badius]|uniref:DUF8208 domain-containing protein n=1 Tax=Bacillus badius TaxID=1455 RepID=A0ABR5AR27_BACBA|nr:hypothetical protein [Bacillus badius]KIL77085.1 hypothetical protein SD77_1837 [Bacillus badius]MED4717842.1 hypothetical protein [Bacillus badius]
MSDEQLIELYKKLDYILHISDGWLWQDFFRSIGGGLIFLLTWLNSFIENIVDKIITLNDFYSIEPVQEFMQTARPIVWGLFLLALMVLGVQFMLNKIDKRNEIILNVILAVSMVVLIPDLMTNMGKLTNSSVEQINPKDTSLASGMVKSNVADVLYYAQNDFKFSKDNKGGLPPQPSDKNNPKIGTTDFTNANRLSEKSLPYISFSEKLDLKEDDGWLTKEDWVKDLDEDTKKVLQKKLAATGNEDKFVVRDLRERQVIGTTLGQESYYRYHVNWGVLIFSLAVTAFAMVITIVKIGRSIFDLAFHQIFGMFVAVTDLTGGQRTKKILVEIMNTFAIIFIMMMLLKIFMMYAMWSNDLKDDIGGIGVLLLLVAGTWALIDAPDIVQRMLGIDAGLRSGSQALMGAYAGAKAAGAGVNATKKGIGGIGKAGVGLASAANFARRSVSGMMSKTPQELSKSGIPKMQTKPIPRSGQENAVDALGSIDEPKLDGISNLNDSPMLSKENNGTGTNLPDKDSALIGSIPHSGAGSVLDDTKEPNRAATNTGESTIPAQQSNQLSPKKETEPIPSGYSQMNSQATTSESTAAASVNSNSASVNLVQERDSGISSIPNTGIQSGSSSKPNGSTISSVDSAVKDKGGTAVPPINNDNIPPMPEMKRGTEPPVSSSTGTSNLLVRDDKGKGVDSSIPTGSQAANYGHKHATHPNTLIGGNRSVQEAKELIVRAGNSGFTLGQNIRRAGVGLARVTNVGNKPTKSTDQLGAKEIKPRPKREEPDE